MKRSAVRIALVLAVLALAWAVPVRADDLPESIADLPVTLIPAEQDSGDAMMVLYSGDGGWAGFVQDLAGTLAAHGIPTVGVNCLSYYWHKKSPETSAEDLLRILNAMDARWHKRRIVLAGYSFGADVLPFLVTRLPDTVRARVAEVVLLSPTHHADFEFHLTSWLNKPGADARPLLPEVRKLAGMHLLVFYGHDDEDALAPDLPEGLARVYPLDSSHRLDASCLTIADTLLQQLHTTSR